MPDGRNARSQGALRKREGAEDSGEERGLAADVVHAAGRDAPPRRGRGGGGWRGRRRRSMWTLPESANRNTRPNFNSGRLPECAPPSIADHFRPSTSFRRGRDAVPSHIPLIPAIVSPIAISFPLLRASR